MLSVSTFEGDKTMRSGSQEVSGNDEPALARYADFLSDTDEAVPESGAQRELATMNYCNY
jgi:hypothetical protein